MSNNAGFQPAAWWEDKRFLIAIVAVMALPLLWPTIPPLTDVLGHMGRYRVQLDLNTSPFLRDYYGFHWQLIGNLGADLLVIPLSPIFGLEFAVKLIAIAVPVLTAVAIVWISFEVHGRPSPAMLLALPFAYGHPFTFGFLNFTLGMALALNGFAFWLYLERTGRYRARALAFVPIALAIWITHSFAWGVLGLLCFSAETVHNRDRGDHWLLAVRRAAVQCLPMAPPLLLFVLSRGGAEGQTGDWFNFNIKAFWLSMVLRDRWKALDIASLVFVFAALIYFIKSNRFAFSRNLASSAFALIIAFICLPRVLLGSAYADMRLIPFIFIILLAAVRPAKEVSARHLGIVAVTALSFFTVRIGANTASFFIYDRLHTRVLAALDYVPRGARLFTLVGRSAGIPWYTDRTEHISALAVVRREAFSNDQWVMKGAQLLSIRKADAPGFVSDPSQLARPNHSAPDTWRTIDDSLSSFPRQAFDYVWIIKPPRFDPKPLSGLDRIWFNETGSLYRVRSGPPATTRRTVTEPGQPGGAQFRTLR